MKTVELKQVEHSVKIGDTCGDIDPNVCEDTLMVSNGEPVGFYLRQVPEKIRNLVEIANAELLSDRVPKSEMRRSSGFADPTAEVTQYSTILGGVPPKPHMRRPYPTVSSVHQVKTAATFIKAMLLVARESEDLVKELMPKVFDFQKACIEKNSPEQYRFGRLFTSSISNFNIAAPFHRDAGNLEGCVNVIIAKKYRATGGNTTVPDYGLTVDSSDNSMLVYPAWRNVHGVTPIRPLGRGGYRNSLVFYPLKAFAAYV